MSNKGLLENGIFGLPAYEVGLCVPGKHSSTLHRSILNHKFTAIQSQLETFKNLPRRLQETAATLGISDKYSLKTAKTYWLTRHATEVMSSPESTNLTAANLCLIRPAKITAIIPPKQAVAEVSTLKIVNNELLLSVDTQHLKFETKITGKLTPGDEVACHWGKIVRKITAPEKEVLVENIRLAAGI